MQDYNNEIDLKNLLVKISEYLSFLFSKKYLIAFCVFVFMLIGLLLANFIGDRYQANLTFVVEEDSSMGGMSSALGLASQFGFDLGGIGGSTFTQSNIIEIIKSRDVISSVLMIERKIQSKEKLLIDHYLDINELRSKLIDDKSKIKSFKEIITQQHDSILNIVWLEIIEEKIKIDLQTDDANIIKLSYTSCSQEFAKCIVEELIDEMRKMYIEHKTAQAQNTIDFLQNRADSVFNELKFSEKEYARTKDINQRIIKASGRLKELQLLRQVEVLNAMYLEIVKNLEVSKLTLLNNTPIINVIDKPILPLELKSMTLSIFVLLSGFIGLLLSSMYYLINKIIKDTLDF